MTTTETFTSAEDRNARFAELRQMGTPGLIRWSEPESEPLAFGNPAVWKQVYFLAYEVETLA